MKKLTRYFFQGIIYTVPLAVTIYVLIKLFNWTDGLLMGVLPVKVPGLGIVAILVLVTVLGFIGNTIIFRPIARFFDRTIQRAPLIKVIYSSVKDLLSAFVGQEKKFDQPVIVKISKIYELEKLGFITRSDLSDIGIEGEKVAVYFPHSYAFSGEMFIVPVENITPVKASPSEIMKFIVSGGVTKI